MQADQFKNARQAQMKGSNPPKTHLHKQMSSPHGNHTLSSLGLYTFFEIFKGKIHAFCSNKMPSQSNVRV
jgi:hypothetical protein